MSSIQVCKRIVLLSLMMMHSLIAHEHVEPSFTINSGEAEYNGQEISLVGDVKVQHGLGTLSAHHLTISAPENAKKYKFSYLTLRDQVCIGFHNGWQLTCEKADVDYEKLHGHFYGSEALPDVLLTLNEKNPQNNSSLVIKGLHMRIDFARLGEKNSKVELDRIQIDDAVRIQYDQTYFLEADQAFYQPHSLKSKPLSSGTLILSSPSKEFCTLSEGQSGKILARTIKVETVEQLFDFIEPHGTLFDGPHQMRFSADKMNWDNRHLILTLAGNVEVESNKTFALKTDEQLMITLRLVNGKKEIRTIVCPKKTEMTYFDEKELHRIVCQGSLMIDEENQRIWMHSPKDEHNQILPDKQVSFEDIMGEMAADQVLIKYDRTNQQFKPKTIELEGHVQIFNRFNGHVQESSSVLQYALADRLEYYPELQEMVLTGKNDQRVLFFDKINSLQMSAPGLKIHFDQSTRKESVQGMGDVRFTFIEQEFNQLKTRFRMGGDK